MSEQLLGAMYLVSHTIYILVTLVCLDRTITFLESIDMDKAKRAETRQCGPAGGL